MTVQTQPWIGEDGALWTPRWARNLVREILADLPCRLAHSLGAGAQATGVTATVPPADADLVVTAALLHDIGYAPALRRTGFHPLDGAAFLVDQGGPERLADLVAHHSEAWLLAFARGMLPALARFAKEEGPVADALVYADMTSGVCGPVMTVTDRLADIEARHAHEAPALRAARTAREPLLLAAVHRVNERMRQAGRSIG